MKIDVSIGELVDKVTILSIKLKKIKNLEKLKNIRKEYELLKKPMEHIGILISSNEFRRLEEINLNLWEIEDKIRIKEAKKEFDDEFIQLARSVYFKNDKRADIKRQINLKYNSELLEEKEYVSYKVRNK
ncbi:MAG: hypothetical protein DRH57_06340 [Candidatus Cloacimonadota bacterium]|nr:MAG: hypothetical protein DRH57_06340 [Candidatus Cloacimonadota bacterium]